MHISTFFQRMQETLGSILPGIVGAILVLVVGLIVAFIVRALIRKSVGALAINERIQQQTNRQLNVARLAASLVFWFIVILSLIGMFNVLNLQSLSTPLSALLSVVAVYLPRIVLAGVLGLVAWFLATVLRKLVIRAVSSTSWDRKLAAEDQSVPMSTMLGNVVYWLVLLLFLPAIVGALKITGVMQPLTDMTNRALTELPHIFAAVVIGFIGWIVAKVARELVSNLLAASGIDKLSARSGAADGLSLSRLGGTLVFILIILPTATAALQALQLPAISAPATHMLELFLAAVPNIIAAALILVIAWYVGRFVCQLLSHLLQNLGFDRLPAHLGLSKAFDADAPVLDRSDAAAEPVPMKPATPSDIVGRITLFFIMLFATVEAAHRLGFSGVRNLLATFIAFGADILLGAVILVVGYWIANLAAKAIQRANPDNAVGLSRIARFAILGLVLAMGLRAMGLADEIVNLAFGLVLGAIAVAVALAFGLGGRDAAGSLTSHWVNKYLRGRDD